VPSSPQGIQVLAPDHGFALNSCDSFKRPRTCRLDSRFGCHIGAQVLFENVQLEQVNSGKRSNLVTSDYN